MQVANEFAPHISARGGDPVGVFRTYLQLLDNLQKQTPQQRGATFQMLAQQFGAAGPQAQAANGGVSPQQYQQLPAEIRELLDWKRQQQNEMQRQRFAQQQQEQAEAQAAEQEIVGFRSQPGREHFDAVSGLMTSLLRDGHVNTLEEAYTRACQIHPQVSASIQQAAQAKAQAEAQAKAAAQAKARRAAQAAGSVRGSAGRAPAPAPGSTGNLRDDIRNAMAELSGRE